MAAVTGMTNGSTQWRCGEQFEAESQIEQKDSGAQQQPLPIRPAKDHPGDPEAEGEGDE